MTDKEILQGIDKLDAELPFDEICVGGKDNWHDIDVHELLYEVRERIKEWHYPSRGEYPTETDDYLLIVKQESMRVFAIGGYFVLAKKWQYVTCNYEEGCDEPIGWMPLPTPPEVDNE